MERLSLNTHSNPRTSGTTDELSRPVEVNSLWLQLVAPHFTLQTASFDSLRERHQARACILVYDITDQDSFQDMVTWFGVRHL